MVDKRPELSRVQKIVLPVLRATFSDYDRSVTVSTWTPDIDYRTLPLFNVKRLGGKRNDKRPLKFGLTVIELSCYDTVDLPTTENLYDVALEGLYTAVRKQTLTPNGYLSSIKETMGPTEFGSPFQDSWRVQGLIQLGVRPLRP